MQCVLGANVGVAGTGRDNSLQIIREWIAKKLNISSQIVGRYLSKLGISWKDILKSGNGYFLKWNDCHTSLKIMKDFKRGKCWIIDEKSVDLLSV